jgi:THO complex subunit 1
MIFFLLFYSAELTKLWNLSSNNLEACRSKERNFLPSLEQYFEDAIQQSSPDSMTEESKK